MIGTVGSDEKAALAREHGCAHTIVYTRENFVERVKEITGGKGVPVVYDGIGKDTFPASLDCLAPRGLFVSFGNASGPVAAFNLGLLAQKGSLYVTRPTLVNYAADRQSLNAMASELFEMVQAGKIKADVRQTFPLKDAADAHRALQARQTTARRCCCRETHRRSRAGVDERCRANARSAPRRLARRLVDERARGVDHLGRREPQRADALRDERVGGGAVQAHADAHRLRGVDALREQRAQNAGQHVARSGRRERRVAARIDVERAVGSRDDAARALQHDMRAQLRRDRSSPRATRSACTACVSQPSSRAASAGAASRASARRGARSASRNAGFAAIALSASASSTSGCA